jgi:DHA1 family tetracycline resistance protein-like MFS transporter
MSDRPPIAPLLAVSFLASLGFSIVMPFLVFLVEAYGGNAFVMGAIGAAFWTAQLVGAPWLGALSDRLGRRRVLFTSQLGALAAWAIFLGALAVPRTELVRVDTAITGAFVVTVPLLLVALSRITDGLVNGSISVANAYLADVTSEDERKASFGRLGAASSLGFVIGPLLAGFLARGTDGVTLLLVIAMALSAVGALLVRFRLPDPQPQPATPAVVVERGGDRAHKVLGGGAKECVQARTPHGARAILAMPEVRPLIALYFLVFAGFSIFTAALPVHASALGWPASKLGVFYSALSVALIATQSGALPRLARRVSGPLLGAAGSALVAASYVLFLGTSDAALFAGAVIYGVGNGIMWPSYLALLSQAGPPSAQGAVQGVASSAGSLASIGGTLAGGVLFEAMGARAFLVSAAALAVAVVGFIRLTGSARTAPRHPAAPRP